MTLIDTSDLSPRVRGVAGSRECPVHAQLTTRVVEGIIAKFSASGESMPRLRVLTPYRAQGRLINRRLRKRAPGLQVAVTTVHSSQASEAEVVVLDLCECAGLPPGAFMRGDGPHATSTRILNTAITRARENLIVICDRSWISTHGGSGVRLIVDAVAQVGIVISGSRALAVLNRHV